MLNKTTMTLWVIMALLVFYSPLLAQRKPADRRMGKQLPAPPERQPFEGWTEERFLDHLDKLKSDIENPATSAGTVEYLGSQFHSIAEKAASLGSELAVQKILAIPDSYSFNQSFPESAFDIPVSKLMALRVLKDFPGVREYVIESLHHQSGLVQIAAASTLLSWGEWDLAAPVICRNESIRTNEPFLFLKTRSRTAAGKDDYMQLQRCILLTETLPNTRRWFWILF